MQRLVSLFVLILTVFNLNATDFKEGMHYKKVTPIQVNAPEVREFFSFYCGHCYRFEHLVKEIKAQMPEGVPFVKNHVDFLPGASRKMQQLLTKALVTAEKLEMEEQQIASIFNYIHVHRAIPTSIDDVKNIFVLNGVDGQEFDRLMASDEVKVAADKMKANQDLLASKNELRSVPTVIVNGKYMIDAQYLNPKNFVEEYNKLVNYLLTLE